MNKEEAYEKFCKKQKWVHQESTQRAVEHAFFGGWMAREVSAPPTATVTVAILEKAGPCSLDSTATVPVAPGEDKFEVATTLRNRLIADTPPCGEIGQHASS